MSNQTATDVTIPALNDLFPLKATLFVAPTAPEGPSVLINSATGVPRRFYAAFATYLAEEHGCAVLTVDFRGHGESVPVGGLKELKDVRIWGEWAKNDQAAATQFLKDKFPGREIVIIGHSVGGHIAPLNPLKADVSRYLFIAVNNAYWGLNRSPVTTFVFPWIVEATSVIAGGYFPARRVGLCDDLPLGIARDWSKWTRFPEYCTVEPPVKEEYDQFVPEKALAVGFSDDEFVQGRKTYDSWLRLMPNAEIPLIFLEPRDIGLESLGHTGFFRRACRDNGWKGVAEWIVDGVQPKWEGKPDNLKAKL